MNKLTLLACLVLGACGPQSNYDQTAQNNDRCMQASNPQECSQFRDAGGDIEKYLLVGLGGAAAGYALHSMMTPSGQRYYMDRDPNYHGAFTPNARYDNSRRFASSPSFRPYSVRYNKPVTQMPTHRTVTTTKTVTKSGSLFSGNRTSTTTTRSVSRPSSSWGSSYSSRPSYSSSRSSSYSRRR